MKSKPWVFVAEDDENWPHLTRNPEEYMHQEGDVFFRHDWGPTNDHGLVMADALNVHEATGLTPSQLQSRVAELEVALQQALRFIREAPVGSGICCCGDGVEGHASAWDCGHTPVDMWDDASSSLLKELSPVAGLVYP